MKPTTVDFSETFVWDGPFGPPFAVFCAVILLAVFTWALWRERHILGAGNSVVFWILRAVALGVALWMLLAPTVIMVETATTRQAVAILTDISGSMTTVDPPGTSDDVHWQAAVSTDDQLQATRSADRAVAAAGMAESLLQQASMAVQQHQPESRIAELTSAADAAVQRVRDHLALVTDGRNDSASEEPRRVGRAAQASAVMKLISGPEFDAFTRLTAALAKGRAPAQQAWQESLPDLQHRMSGIRRQLQEIARDISDQQARSVAQSSAVRLRNGGPSRLSRTTDFLETLNSSILTTLRDKADIRVSSFDRSLSLLSHQESPATDLRAIMTSADRQQDEAARTGTDISAALEQVVRDRSDQPLAAVFLVSDMSHNRSDAASPRDVAATFGGTPVYVIPVGNPRYVRDVVLQTVFAPGVAMRNDDIVIEATLQAHECQGESVTVRLLQDGEEAAQETVEFDSGFASRRVRFDQKMSTVGTQKFQVSITPLSGELTEQNNFDDFEVNVTRSDIKLLLADELPRWEYRYLAQLFRRDPKVECDELLFRPRMIATGHRQESQTFPVTVDEWDQYDVVLLGDLPPEHLPAAAQESLIEWLKFRGGTVVLIAGHAAMPQAYPGHPLFGILPVTETAESLSDSGSGYAFHVTEEGRNHNALMIADTEDATQLAWSFVNQFAPLNSVSPWRQPRPAAHTLISAVPRGFSDVETAAAESAFLCWQAVGRGMAVYLSGPDTYRLRFLRGDRLHYRFWGQLLRWAIASDLSVGQERVRIRTDRTRYTSAEPVEVTVRLMNEDGSAVLADDLQVVATHNDGEQTSVPLTTDPANPGQYSASLTQLSAGVYRVEPTGTTVDQLLQEAEQERPGTSLTVQAEVPLEFLDTRSDRALAQQIADITSGQVLPPTAVEEVLTLTDLEPKVTRKPDTRPLWLEWKYLWIIFGCLQTEWIIRKWKGVG
ncbi:MAG: hypothetical protein R3C49_19015 [Planctomycetaceae bacterium]